jgi:hypothetical protein
MEYEYGSDGLSHWYIQQVPKSRFEAVLSGVKTFSGMIEEFWAYNLALHVLENY